MNKKYVILIFTMFFFYGCSFKYDKNAKYDLRVNNENRLIISGDIVKNKKSNKNIYVVLYKHIKGDINKLENYKLIDFSSHYKSDEYKFFINKGTYFIYACQNLETLRNKKYAYEFLSDLIYVNNETETKIDIKLNEIPSLTIEDNILISSTKDKSIFKEFGMIEKRFLNDKIFKRKNASLGLWNPLEFFSKIGGGVYLLGDYNKSKKIVLFVHGMNGTPLDFKTIINNLDKEKYLPIVYYYSTGINLNYSVDGLKFSLDKLNEKYPFNELYIIAHSMGGLVSKGLINIYSSKTNIKKFISISTPWNGQKFAKLGKRLSTNLKGSFENMVPGSAFIENNISIKKAEDMKYYLFFSYKGTNSLILDTSNDGVISLSSQLYEKVQKTADKVYGIDKNHIDILSSKITIDLINNILEED